MAIGEVMLGLAGVVGLAVAFALLALAPASRATRVFAFFLALHGIRIVLQWGVAEVAPPLGPAGDSAAVYALLPTPFLLAAFALRYPHPRGRLGRSRWVPPSLLAAGVALDALYLLDHALWVTAPGQGIYANVGPLLLVGLAATPFSCLVALMFVRDVIRGGQPAYARSLLLLAAVLTVSPGYTAARVLGYWVAGIGSLTVTGFLWQAASLLPILAAIALLARHAAAAAPEAFRPTARRSIAALAFGPVGGVAVTALVAGAPAVEPIIRGVPAALFAMASPLLVAYALLRHRLFDIDLRVKHTIRDSTVLGTFAAVLLLTREGAQQLVASEVAILLGLAAAGLMVLGLSRLRRLGSLLADRALPEVADDPAYLNQRKLEVYRAALEEAFVEQGEVPPREATRLAALRRELGLTDRDHNVLSFAVRASRTPWRPKELEPGALVLGRYRIGPRLGRGSNGTTFLAADEAQPGRQVAVKALRPDWGGDPEVLREARALQAVRHPSVVAMHEVADLHGQALLVMEYLAGGSLGARLERGPLGEEEFRRVARGLLAALDAVHAAGLVHRDVKPSNVLLTAEGEAKLSDFGVAHMSGLDATLGGGPGDLAGAVGTVRFMSPEQARGRRVTHRSDLFSAAATLYEAHTGRPYLAPRPGESAVELQMRAAAGQPFPEGFPGPPALRSWFARALAPGAERRFASAPAMLAALERALARPPVARGAQPSLHREAQPRPPHADDVAGA